MQAGEQPRITKGIRQGHQGEVVAMGASGIHRVLATNKTHMACFCTYSLLACMTMNQTTTVDARNPWRRGELQNYYY
jgi:hypothetical protein